LHLIIGFLPGIISELPSLLSTPKHPLSVFENKYYGNNSCFYYPANDNQKEETGLRKMALRNLWSGALSNERVGNYSNAWISNG
jgi:hypothetical protein